jgi:hypothetical protein
MADKNQLKIADPIDFSEDDPFAELTRIMGFDPRQPARQAAPAPAPQPAPVEQAAEDDFSLDLEKELLGGFDLDDSEFNALDAPVADETVAYAEPSLEEPALEVSPSVSESEMAEVDFDFSGAFEAAMGEPEVAAEPELKFDGDLDAAFAATAGQAEIADSTDDMDFDLGLTDEQVRALDAPSPLPVTPQAVTESREPQIDADLYAAMADIDMDFQADSPVAEPVAGTHAEAASPVFDDAYPLEAAPETATAETLDADADFFDESDFHFEDEAAAPVAPQAIVHAEPAAQPEIDESVFEFAADDFQVEAPESSEQHEVEAFSFDDADFEMEDVPAVEAEAPAEVRDEPLPVIPVRPEPVSAADFQLSVPAYVPRKLPVSPMDVAAEEYRQREAVAAPPPQDFNLEDELNALLGNVRSISHAAPAEPEAAAYSPPASERYEPAFERYEPASQHYEPAIEQPSYRAPEPVAFDAPENPVDIDDNLNWEFEDAFAAEAAADDEPYAEQEQFDAGAYQPAEPYASDEDGLSQPIDLDAAFEQIAAELRPADPAPSYADALAGAAIGAAGYAASRSDRDFGARPYEVAPRQSSMDQASPHRDPVVRGNPLKEDPLDVITQLAAKYSKKEPITSYGRDIGLATGTASAYSEAERVEDDFEFDLPDTFEAHPEVETVEVADQAIALADDLDIPELPEDEDLPAASYDDLDTEFSSLLTDMNNEPQAAQDGYDDPLAGDAFSARPFENPNHVRNGATVAHAGHQYANADAFSLDADDLPGSRAAGGYGADAYEYDPEYDQDIPENQFAAEARRPQRPRALLIAGIVGGVALIGALGAFALSFGGDAGSDTPALVKADDGPIKVKPENTGGRVVPNQESKVYDTVAGEGAVNDPQQEKLVTTAEEPMDVAPPAVEEDDAATASGKSEDRIEQIVQDVENVPDSEIVAVTPRKVRTMVVKPDGTLVPREDEPEAAPSNEQTDTIAAAIPEAAPAPAIPEATGALPATAAPAPGLAPAAPEEVTETAAAEPPSDDAGVMPETAPIAPLRPADQPIDVVGEVKPDQVAAATTATASVGNWAMQIASQPSEAAAQSSYQDLARRYSGVLQGREVNIVKAEIAGKGTFWRVRVPAPTRQEAIGLCESYKSAGGNCFVSK